MKQGGLEFLKLFEEYKKLEEQLKLKAWEIAPDDIKELLCGKRGLFAKNAKIALKWLIQPKWRLNDKSPAEAIIEGKTEEVKKLLDSLDHDVYS